MRIFWKTSRFLTFPLIVGLASIWLPSLAPAQTTSRLIRTSGRVTIKPPSQPLHLGEENQLSISLQGSPVVYLFTMQSQVDANDNSSVLIKNGNSEATIQHRPDGSAYISFVPQRLGRIEIQLDALFADAGVEIETAIVEVIATRPPERLVVEPNDTSPSAMRMDLSESKRRNGLQLSAVYPGLKEPLKISPAEAQFKVTMAKGDPVVRFDPATAEINALRIGHALIETTYKGLTHATCVVVAEQSPFDPSKCLELRSPLTIAPAREESADALFALGRSTLPYGPNDERRGRFLADERLALVVPSHEFHVAENNGIGLKLTGPAVARIECHPSHENQQCVAWKGAWSHETLPLVRNPDGTASVNVFPTKFGTEEYTFFVLFVDGGVALKKIKVDAGIGTAKPQSIARGCGETSPEAQMPVQIVAPKDGKPSLHGEASIVPTACYDGIRGGVMLPANLVTYNVRTEGTEPVLQLDTATGKATAVRPGQALVQQTFAGFQENTCVVVKAPASEFERDGSNCRALREKYGAPLPPLQFAVRPPQPPRDTTRPLPMMKMLRPDTPPTVDAIGAATLSPNGRDPFPADERLDIPVNGVSAILGVPTELPIRLTGPEVLHVSIYQKLLRYPATGAPIEYEEPTGMEMEAQNRIRHAENGDPYLQIVALRTGVAEFRIVVLFADGGVATRIVRIPVSLPANRVR